MSCLRSEDAFSICSSSAKFSSSAGVLRFEFLEIHVEAIVVGGRDERTAGPRRGCRRNGRAMPSRATERSVFRIS